MILVFGIIVVGCKDDDVQIVAFEYAESASNVNVSINGDQVNVSFSGVKNAVSYDIYGQQKPQNGEVVDIKNLSTIQAKGYGGVVEVRILKSQLTLISVAEGSEPVSFSQNLRFGVTVTDIDKNKVPSKIVWSDYVNISFP